jgi:hypothetical protein
MKTTQLLVLMALLSPPAGWADSGSSLPSPDPDRGTVAVTVVAKSAVGPEIPSARVYFVRLDDASGVLEADELIPSSFSDGDQAYLLNCEPGRYVAVAGELSYGGSARTYHVFLDEATISGTEVTVEPGEIAFMGSILVNLGTKIQRADAAQSHFVRVLDSAVLRKGYLRGSALEPTLYLGKLVRMDRSAQAERDFLALAERQAFDRHEDWQAKVRESAGSVEER